MLDGSEQYRTTYIGLTDANLVFAISKDPRKPSRLQRASLGNVSIVKFKENRKRFLMDVLVINTGKKKLTLRTGASQRPVIHEFLTDLDRRKRESDISWSYGLLDGKLARQATPLPLHIRLIRLLEPVPRDITTSLRVNGPARASLRASRYSLTALGTSLAAGLFLVVGIFALAFIFPGGLAAPLRDILLFLFTLPILLTTLLGSVTAVAAGGLAIYSIFKRGERPLTIIGALLGSAGLLFVYYLIAALLLTFD
jgi:hypothetical protein